MTRDPSLTISVECSVCGRSLSAEFDDSAKGEGTYYEKSLRLRVEPCADCIDEAYNRGNDAGYADGYDDGKDAQ